jgi:transcriptional regulator with XRE-family HTH domain
MRGVQVIGETIRSQRRQRGLTQEQLAAQADCDVKTLRQAEHSRAIDLSSLKRIALALNLNYVDLIHP